MGSKRHLLWNNLGDVMDGQDGFDGRNEDIDANRGKSQERTSCRRFKRHSKEQTKELKAVFSDCTHPDESQRQVLSKMLGLNVTQIKHWFQNQRSQMKNLLEREKSKELREENEMLREENMALKEAMHRKVCLTCGGPTVPAEEMSEQRHPRKLKGEVLGAASELPREAADVAPPVTAPARPTRLPCCVLAVAGGALVLESMTPPPSELPASASGLMDPVLFPADGPAAAGDDRAALLRRLDRAMEEFMTLMGKGQPMWLPTPDGGEVLNEDSYAAATFPGLLGLRPVGFVMEGTRAAGVVVGTTADIVGVLVDAERWSEMFPEVVATATTGVVLVPGGGAACDSHDGLVQMMNAELRVLSPRVPVRSIKFARQSKQLEPGKWAVVDVSIDGVLGQHAGGGGGAAGIVDLNAQTGGALAGYTPCRLLPTGCLIEDMNNGYCKITWIVDAEYDESTVPELYRPLLRSGQALGARRWVAALQRNCEYLAVMMRCAAAPSLSNSGISPEGRRSVLELSRRMTASFCTAVCGPVAQAPTCSVEECRGGAGAGSERFTVAVRVVTAPCGEQAGGGLVLNAAGTVWLPGAPAQRVFDYLCGWNTIDNGADMVEEGYVITGQIISNAVSVLLPAAAGDGITSGGKNLILKEARTDSSCSMVVYASVEAELMRAAMSGSGGLAPIALLPSGFAVLPDGHSKQPADADHSGCGGGSLVTAMFQAAVGEGLGEEAVERLGRLLCGAVQKIRAAVKADVVVAA